jgi:hypothetical protein
MTEPIIPIVPRNPNIFPVAPVDLPRIDPEEREQRRREREEEEAGARPPAERRQPRPQRARRPAHQGDDGHPHVDVTA